MNANKIMTVKMTPIDIDNLAKLKKYYQEERHINLTDSGLTKMVLADYLMMLEKVELKRKVEK